MIGAVAAGTVTRPITAGVIVLLYVDMRMRKEGLDLALRTASGPASRGPVSRVRRRVRPAGHRRPARRRLRDRVAAAAPARCPTPGAPPPAAGPAAVVTAAGP